jgi:hypothetical protein
MADQAVTIEIEQETDKPRLRSGDTSQLDMPESELSEYGKKVKNRIDKLRFAFHEERRMREQSQRDQGTAVQAAQRLYQENQELKRNVNRTERAFVHQAIERADSQMAQASERLTRAHEEGKGEDIAKATQEVAAIAAERERLKMLQPPPEAEEPPPARQSAPPPVTGVQQPSQEELAKSAERFERWKGKNKWFQANREMTAVALSAHDRLAQQNISEVSNPDLYWSTIDKTVKAVFPEQFNGGGSDHDETEDEESESRPEVTGSRRSSDTASSSRTKVVRLSESQVRLARVLGITPQQYAEQLVKEGEA